MRITVVGGGSIGLLLTAKLMDARLDPVVVTRRENQAFLIQEKGIHMTSVDGLTSVLHTNTVSISRMTSLEETDWVFITVKQTELDQVLPFLAKMRVKYGCVAFQNGMGHMEKMERQLPFPLYMAITSEGAYRREQNEIVHAGTGETWIGRWNKDNKEKLSFEGIDQLIVALKKSGMEIARDEFIQRRAWRKLLINCAVNPLTALYEIRNGELIAHAGIREVMRRIWDEAVGVAEKEGIEPVRDTWEELIKVCRNTSQNRSSMLQDIEKGKKTEIDYLNGYIVKRGEAFQLPVETNRVMVSLIHGKEQILKEKR